MKHLISIGCALILALPVSVFAGPDDQPTTRPTPPPASSPGNKPGGSPPANRPNRPGAGKPTPGKPGQPPSPPGGGKPGNRPPPSKPQPPQDRPPPNRPSPDRPPPNRPSPDRPSPGRPPSARPPAARPPAFHPRPPSGWHRPSRNQWYWRGKWVNRIRGPAFAYPRGWSYRYWWAGDILPATFLASQYFYDDVGPLGLETPPLGYRWVRYGPDLLLVNLHTGEVEQVAYGVFY